MLNGFNYQQKREQKIIKLGTRDKAEGKMQQTKGKVKESVEKTFSNSDIEADGKEENFRKIVQKKFGTVKRAVQK